MIRQRSEKHVAGVLTQSTEDFGVKKLELVVNHFSFFAESDEGAFQLVFIRQEEAVNEMIGTVPRRHQVLLDHLDDELALETTSKPQHSTKVGVWRAALWMLQTPEKLEHVLQLHVPHRYRILILLLEDTEEEGVEVLAVESQM